MDDELARVVDGVGQARAKNDRVDSALDFRPHETGHRRVRLLFVVRAQLLDLFQYVLATGEGEQARGRVLDAVTHVRQHRGQVPSLEDVLVDVVAVVRPHELLRQPALLEERGGRPDEHGFVSALSQRSLPEVVQILRAPALRVGVTHDVLGSSSKHAPCAGAPRETKRRAGHA